MGFNQFGVVVKLSIIFLLIFVGCSKFLPTSDKAQEVQNTFKVFHFNIKELTTAKLLDANNAQIDAATKILSRQNFDILSINEIQYDLPGVPSLDYQSKGENFTRLLKRIGLNPARWNQIFAPANTGTRAKRDENGAYFYEESELARKHADPINYGLFPAQYSTAGAIKQKVSDKAIINDVLWRDFNPKANPSQYATESLLPLPSDMVLFDKNFNHAVTNLYGKKLHVIFFHTVPSYHFGNKNSPNYQRNADQLRFLEWYVTGKTDFKVNLDRSQWPLISSNDGVIIVGDLNADVNQKDNPGGFVLKRLMKKLNPWMENPGVTNESSGFAPKPFQLLLDYIIVSQNIEIIEAGVLRPDAAPIELGCDEKEAMRIKANLRRGRSLVDYQDRQTKRTCFRTVSNDYYQTKTASDHFPIYATLKFK